MCELCECRLTILAAGVVVVVVVVVAVATVVVFADVSDDGSFCCRCFLFLVFAFAAVDC